MKIYTKESLTAALIDISKRGWILNRRKGNAGAVGNTLEDLLGIPENNLPLPNAAEWELKAQKINTSALTTLFHMEPSPRAMNIVPNFLLPVFGWPHEEAGEKYPEDERSFRQTINFSGTGRGFYIEDDTENRRILISFDAKRVAAEYEGWLNSVNERMKAPDCAFVQPYWGYDDLFGKAKTKLCNCFYAKAETKREHGEQYFHYAEIYRCSDFSLDKFLAAIKDGNIYIDFDARTGHNHGTKFRIKAGSIQSLYKNVTQII